MNCPIDNCGRPVVAREMCLRHYQRQRRTGSVSLDIRRDDAPLANVPWRIPGYLPAFIRQAAELEQTTPGEWLESVILAALPWERLAE